MPVKFKGRQTSFVRPTGKVGKAGQVFAFFQFYSSTATPLCWVYTEASVSNPKANSWGWGLDHFAALPADLLKYTLSTCKLHTACQVGRWSITTATKCYLKQRQPHSALLSLTAQASRVCRLAPDQAEWNSLVTPHRELWVRGAGRCVLC